MNALTAAQVVVFGLLVILSAIANSATIFVLIKKSKNAIRTLDATTIALMINIAVCDLILCVNVPLRLWNALAGSQWPFDGSFTCYIYFRMLLTTRVTGSLHVSLAVTRLIAVFWPHKFHAYMRSIFVKILLHCVSINDDFKQQHFQVVEYSNTFVYRFLLRTAHLL